MAVTRLIQTLAFANVAAGAEATLAHAINVRGVATVPDLVLRSSQSCTIVNVTSAQCTVRNDGAEAASFTVWLERKHSIPRQLGPDGASLSPVPFVPEGGSSDTPVTSGVRYYDFDAGIQAHQEIRYLRPGGDNGNDGLTPATAWAGDLDGLKQAIEWLASGAYALSQIIDITGCTVSAAEELFLGGANLGSLNYNLDFSGTGPSNFLALSSFQLRAEPTPVLAGLNITGVAQDAASRLYTATVSNVLVANAHIGQMVLGEVPGEWARVVSNTANTLLLTTSTNPQGWTNPGIYTEGATLTLGDPAAFFGNAVSFLANGDWFMSGIRFESTGGSKNSAVYAITNAPVFWQMCAFEGHYLAGGTAPSFMDCCFIDGGTWGIDGGQLTMRQCFVNAATPSFHGAGGTGNSDAIDCYFNALPAPYGGGNVESAFYAHLDNVHFNACTAGAVQFSFGNSRITDARFENTTGDCVIVEKKCHALMSNVQGTTGNTGYGCRIRNGAQVDVSGTMSVSGALGNRIVGGNAVGVWATLPETDVAAGAPQFCRVF